MEGDRTDLGGHRQDDDVQQDISGQLGAGAPEPCCLETFVDRREQTIVIDSRSACRVVRRLDSHVSHIRHTDNIPDDLGTNKLAYETVLKSSSEGGTADLFSEQGLRKSPERSSITIVLPGTPVDGESHISQNDGRSLISTDTRQNISDQEQCDLGSRLPAQIHYRDMGTCTMQNTKSGDQTDGVSWLLDTPASVDFAVSTQPILSADTRCMSNVNELSEYPASSNNTHIVSRLERSSGMCDDGRKNQVSLRLLERRKTIEVDKEDLSGLEVRHTSNLNFSISSQEQLGHHSIKSEVNIVWGKTIDADEICSKERLFRSELCLNPFLSRSLDECTDYFSADVSSDTVVTSDYTDSFVETGDSMYASDCNDSFLEQTDIYPDKADTKYDLTRWKHEEFTNNRDDRDTPHLVSTLSTDFTNACGIKLDDIINQKQPEISLVDDVVEHPLDRKLLYKVSDIVANLGWGASDVDFAATGVFHRDCVIGVDQSDISYHSDQDSCLPILHVQITNSPHSRDDIDNCDAVDEEMHKSGQDVCVGATGQSQEDIRHIQFDGNAEVGLRVSKDLPHLQLLDSRIIHTSVATDHSSNNTEDDADTVDNTDHVMSGTRQSQEGLPSVQLGESVILTVPGIRDAASLNRVDINNLLLSQNSSDASVHCLLDGSSQVCNQNECVHVTVSSDAVCSADSVTSVTVSSDAVCSADSVTSVTVSSDAVCSADSVTSVTVSSDDVCSADSVTSVTTDSMTPDYSNIAELSVLTPDSTPGNQGSTNTNSDNHTAFMTQEKSAWCAEEADDDGSSTVNVEMAGTSLDCMLAGHVEQNTSTSQPLAIICDADISIVNYTADDKPVGDENAMKCVERTEMFLQTSDSTTCNRSTHISKAAITTHTGSTDSQKINEQKSEMYLPLSRDIPRGSSEAADSFDDNEDCFVLVTSRRNRKQKKSHKFQPNDAISVAKDCCDGADPHKSTPVHHKHVPSQIVETPLVSSVLDQADIVETPLPSSVLDQADIIETPLPSSVLDQTDIVQTTLPSSVLDHADIVETPLSSSVLDHADIVETPLPSSVLDQADIVETPLPSSVDQADIVETPLPSSVLDQADIVETLLPSSVLDKTDINEAPLPISASSSLMEKTIMAVTPSSNSLVDNTDIAETSSSSSLMDKLPSVSMFSPSEPSHTDLHDAHICCINIAPPVVEQAVPEQTFTADEVQRLDNNRDKSTGDLHMTDTMFEPETTAFVSNEEISEEGVLDTNSKTDGEDEPFESAAEDGSSEEFICRMLEGIDGHTQEYGEEFLHSDECGGMLLNIYTAGHRRILKPHRRFTKPDHETTSRSGDSDYDFTDPVTELKEDQKSVDECTVVIGDLNVPADKTLVNRVIAKEGKRRGKGHKRKRNGTKKVETPRPNSECAELNMSDDAGSIDTSLEDLEHFGSDHSARLSDEDSASDSDKCVPLFDQHNNVSNGMNVIHQRLDSHVDEVSAEITGIDNRHSSSDDAAADLDTDAMLGRDVEASLRTNELCTEQGTMSNQHPRQENSVDRFETFINVCAAFKLTLTTQSHTERTELVNCREEVETAGNRPGLLLGSHGDRDHLCCQSETGNSLFPGENFLKYTSAPNVTAALGTDIILTNTSKSGGMIERGKVPLPFNECVPVITELDSDVSNNDNDVVDLRSISVVTDTHINDSKERAHDYFDGTIQEHADIGHSTGNRAEDTGNRTEDTSVTLDEGAGEVQSTVADHESRQGDYADVELDMGDDHLQRRPDTSETISHRQETSDTSVHTTCTHVDHGQKVTQADHENTTVEDPENVQLHCSSEPEIVHLSDVVKENADKNADYGDESSTQRLTIGNVKWTNVDIPKQRDDPADGIRVSEENKIYSVEGTGGENDCEEQRRRDDLTDANHSCRKTSLPGREGDSVTDTFGWRLDDIAAVRWQHDDEEDSVRNEFSDRIQENTRTNGDGRTEDTVADSLQWKVEDVGIVKWESAAHDKDVLPNAITDKIQENIGIAADGREEENIIDNAEWRVEDIGDVRWESDEEDAAPTEDVSGRHQVPSDRTKYDSLGDHVALTVADIREIEVENVDGEKLLDSTARLHMIHNRPANSRIEESVDGITEGFGDLKYESIDAKEKWGKDMANRVLEGVDHSVTHGIIDRQTHMNPWGIVDIGNVKYDNYEDKVTHNISVNLVHNSRNTTALARNCAVGNQESMVDDSGALTLKSSSEETAKRSDILDVFYQDVAINADGCMGDKVAGTVECSVKDAGDVKWENKKEEEEGRQNPIDTIPEMNSGMSMSADRIGEMPLDNSHWRVGQLDDEQWQIDEKNVDRRNDLEYRPQENSEENTVEESDDMQAQFVDNIHIKWNRDSDDRDVKTSFLDGINQNRNNSPVVSVADHNDSRNEERKAGDAGGVIWGDRNKEDGVWRKYQTDGDLLNREAMNVCRKDTFDADNVMSRIEDDDMKWQSLVEKIDPSEAGVIHDPIDVVNTSAHVTGDNVVRRVDDIGDVKWESNDEDDTLQDNLTDRWVQSRTDTVGYVTSDSPASNTLNSIKWQNESDNTESTGDTENQIQENTIEVAVDMKLITPDDIDSENCAGRSSGSRKFNGQSSAASVNSSHIRVLSTGYEDVTSQNDVSGNAQFQASATEPVENIGSTRHPVAVGFTEEITHSPGSRSSHDCTNLHGQLTHFNRPANHQTSVIVDSEHLTSDISHLADCLVNNTREHLADCLVNNTQEHSPITDAASCVNASVLLTDVDAKLKTTLSESKQNRKKKNKKNKKKRERNVQTQALEQAVNVKESFGEDCAVSEVMGVAVAADKFSAHCSPDDSGRGESLNWLTPVLVVGSAEKHSGNTAAGSDESVKLTDVYPGCEHTHNLGMLHQCDVENNETESAAAEVDISCHDITKADPGELSIDDEIKHSEQATTSLVSVEHSADLLHASTTSSLQLDCFSGLENEINIHSNVNIYSRGLENEINIHSNVNIYSRGDNQPVKQPSSSRSSSSCDKTLLEGHARVSSICHEDNAIASSELATQYQTDHLPHQFVERCEVLLLPDPKSTICKRLLEDITTSKARAEHLLAQITEAGKRQNIRELKSSEEPTLTPAGHLWSEIGLLETSARDQLESLQVAVVQQHMYEEELRTLTDAIEESQQKLQASPVTAESVSELRQLMTERTNLTEQIKHYKTQISEVNEKIRQLALDSAQLSPSVFRKHYHPESAYSDYFAATSQHKRGAVPFNSQRQLFYASLPAFDFPSTSHEELSSSLARNSPDKIDNWKQWEHQKPVIGTTPISQELPRLIPPPRTDSIPRPTWSGEIMSTAASHSDMSRGTSVSHSIDSPRSMSGAFEASASSSKSIGSVSVSTEQTREGYTSSTTTENGPEIVRAIDTATSEAEDSNVDRSPASVLHGGTCSSPTIDSEANKSRLPAIYADQQAGVDGQQTDSMHSHGSVHANNVWPNNWNTLSASAAGTNQSPSTQRTLATMATQYTQDDSDTEGRANQSSLEAGSSAISCLPTAGMESPQKVSGEKPHEQDANYKKKNGDLGVEAYRKQVDDIKNWLGKNTDQLSPMDLPLDEHATLQTQLLKNKGIQEQVSKHLRKLSDLILQCDSLSNEDPITARKLQADLLDLQRDLEKAKKSTAEKQFMLEAVISDTVDSGTGREDELGPEIRSHIQLINEIADQGRHPASSASNVTTDAEVRDSWQRLSKDLAQRTENLECILRTQKPEDVKICLHAPAKSADSTRELQNVTKLIADLNSAWILQQTQLTKKQLHLNEALTLQLQHQSVIQNISNWLDLAEQQLFTVPLSTEEQVRHNENLGRQIQCLQEHFHEMNIRAMDQIETTGSANRELIKICHSSLNDRLKMTETTTKLQGKDLQQTETQWKQYNGEVNNLHRQLQDIQRNILLPTATQSLDQLMSNTQQTEVRLKICENQLQELRMTESSLIQKYPKGVFISELVPLQSKYMELHRKAVEKKSATQNLVTFRDQYKKMLKDCADFLQTAEYKLGAISISAKDLIDLKQQLAAFKEFFSDIEVHKAMLDSLASNCDPSTRIQFQQQHADLSARIHVLVDQANLHEHRLERLTRQWADLEDKYFMLKNILLSLEAQMPKSTDSEDSLATIQDKSNKFKWLQEELSANRDSVFEVMDKGKQILHTINCPSLDTAITELKEKWVSLNATLTQELNRTESLCDLLSMFETELAVLSSWLATAKIKLEGFRTLPAASLQNIGVVRREVEKILEFRKEVANQVLLKNKVLSIGNQLLQSKTYDTRGLSKKLQDFEEEWKQLEQGIADTQEHLLQVQMKLMPSRQALKELTDWIGEMSKSLEKDAGFVTKTPAEIESMVKKYKSYQTELAGRQMSMDFVNRMVLVPQAVEVSASHEKLEFAENLKELNKQWEHVTKEVKDKLSELEDAYKKWDEYGKAVEKLQAWCHQQEDKMQSYQLTGNKAGVEQTLRNCSALQQQLQCKQSELEAARILGHHLSHDFPDSQQSVRDSLTALDHNMRRLEEHSRQQQGELADILGQWNQYRSELADLNMILSEAEYALDHYKLIRGDISTLHSQVVKLKDLHARFENKSDQLISFSAISGQLRWVCEPSVQVDIQKTESDLQTKWTQLSTGLIQRCNEYEHYLDEWQLFENQYRRIQDWLDSKEALYVDLSSINTDSVNPETLTKCTQLQQDLDSFESQVSDLHRQSAMLTVQMNPSTVFIIKSRQSAIDQKMLTLKQMLSQLSVTVSRDLSMREKFKEIFEDVKKFLSYAEVILDCHDPMKTAKQEDIQLRFEQLSNLLLLFSSNYKQLDEVNDLGYQLALNKIDASRLRELNHKWYKLCEDTKDRSKTLQANLLQQQNFTSKCEAWKTFVAQTEHKLAEQVKGNLDDLSDQLHNIEKFENELYSQQQIIHAILSDGQKMISAGEVKDKNEFQRKINLLFEQWQSVSRKANQKKAAIEEIKNKWLVFNTLSQQLKDWLTDTENYLEASPLDSNSLQVLKNFIEKVQAVKHEFQMQEATYNKILDLGENLLQHADGKAAKEIEDTLSLLKHKRHKVLSTMEENKLHMEDIDHQWVRCESEVDDMMCQLTEIRNILNTDIPTTYDELQVEINKCKDIEKEFIESEIKEQSLLVKKEHLARIIQTEDMSLLQQRIQLLTKQREELQHQTQAREDKITDALFKWTDFNKCLKLLVDWIEDTTVKISNQNMVAEDLLAKLENEYKKETECKEIQKDLILEQGSQLVKVSDNIRASEIKQKLKQLEDKWQHLNRDMDTRLFKLRETVMGLKQLDASMSSLSQWLSAVERVLHEDIMFSSNDRRDMEAKLQDNQVLQQDIEHHAESVSSLLRLCQNLLNDSDACPTETEVLALRHSMKNLDKRWQDVCVASLHRKTRIEETWKLWMTFQDGCGKFSEWITQKEQEVADSEIEALNVKTAKTFITKYEDLQRSIHDHLCDLEHINRTYCQLVVGCTDSRGVHKDMMTKLNERWDALLFKVTEIMKRLCSSSVIREDFETTRISLRTWLRNIDDHLTSVQNSTALDLQARFAVVQDLDAEICNKRHRIEYLDQAGAHLMQKADSQEALRVQRELDEFKLFYKTVQDRLNTIKLHVEHMSVAKADDKSTIHSSEDRHQQLDADRTRELQNVSEKYAVRIAELEEYLQGSPPDSPAVRQKTHAYNGRGSVSPLRGTSLTTAKFESSSRKSQSPSFLQSRSPTLKSMTTRSVSPHRRVSPSQRSPKRSAVGITGQAKIDVLMEQLAEALKECNIKLVTLEQTFDEHFGDTEQSIQTLAECESAVDCVKTLDRLLKTEAGLLTIDSVDAQVKYILQQWEYLRKQFKLLRPSQEEYDLTQFSPQIQHQDFLSTVDDCHLWLEDTEKQVRYCEPVSSGVDESALREKCAKLQGLQCELIKNQAKIMLLKETADQLLKTTELPEFSTARDKIYIIHKRVQALSHLIPSYITALEKRMKAAPKRETHHDSFEATEGKSSGIRSSYASRSSPSLESESLTLRTGNQSSFAMSRLRPSSLYSRTKDRENSSTELNPVTAGVQHSKHNGLALLTRVTKTALPILLLLLLLWLLFFLIPACEDENSCMRVNSLQHSTVPMLRYTDGAPPV